METAVIVAKFAIMYGIPAAQELVKLFQLKDPTAEDWAKVFALAQKPYEQYIKEAQDRATS